MSLDIIVASNAGPAKFEGGQVKLSGGGVVTALSGLGRLSGGLTWVQAPATTTEFQMAARGTTTSVQGIKVVLGKLSPQQRDAFYTRISNGVLVHCALYQKGLAKLPGSWGQTWKLFKEGSQAMAQAIREQVLLAREGKKFGIFIEDYQMVLVPELTRRLLEEDGRIQDVSLQMHIHTTWAGPEHWDVLPADARAEIARGMLGADTLGFHSARDVRNFADCVRQWLPSKARVSGDTVRFEDRTVRLVANDRTVRLVANPIGIDTVEMSSRLESRGGQDAISAIERKIGGRPYVFAGIGRTDPTKKLDVLLSAFDRFLDANPDKVAESVLLLHLTESRLDVPVYKRHKDLLDRLVREINNRYRQRAGGRDVVEAYYASDPYLHLGLYARYTVLAVPSERDGFALTAVEGPWLNQRDGVLILSTGTGAYELLSDGVLRFEPGRSHDEIEQLARLLKEGSEMPLRKRQERQERLRRVIHRHNLAAWLDQRLRFAR